MSEIKVNKISPKQTCTQVTLGDSGDTIIIPSGVTLQNLGTATGFGASFDATVRTSSFNAVKNTGYFINTTAGTITVTLPASPALGDQITLVDYAGTFDTNGLGINLNGNKLNGVTTATGITTERQSCILTYSDVTQGWLVTAAGVPSFFASLTISFITAAGSLGTITDAQRSSYTLSTAAATATFGGLSYTIQSGSLPGGLSLNSSTAAITGTATAVISQTTYTFTVRAASTLSAATYQERTFSITVQEPAAYVAATGGTVLTSGDFKTHVFTGSGCFVVSSAGNSAGSNSVEYLVIAGGGGGGGRHGAGAGAGGFRLYTALPASSPLNGPAALPVSATTYPVTVGGGGGGGPTTGSSGNPSVFSTITSAAGGSGGGGDGGGGGPGGSGGAGTTRFPSPNGDGNSPPVSPPQGNPGSPGARGGGGAGSAGYPSWVGGDGSYISPSFFGPTAPSYGTGDGPTPSRYFAGGGGGENAPGGFGGGGNGSGPPATPAPANMGGGGGGAGFVGFNAQGGNGGSGIVVIRYKYQ
jgi:hypothetical protein